MFTMKDVIILMGVPGSGKGTQAKFLKNKHGFEKISFGEYARSLMKAEGELGESTRKLLGKGDLLPDELINNYAKKVVTGDKKIILDGYPRTIVQAEFIAQLLTKLKLNYLVIFIDLDEEEIYKRLSLRKRIDDKPEIIKERIVNYKNQTLPMLSYFKNCNKLVSVNGNKSINEVSLEIEQKLNDYIKNNK